jgi:hypothetical protein
MKVRRNTLLAETAVLSKAMGYKIAKHLFKINFY